MPEKDIEEFCPANQSEWREWLEENHEKLESVWLIYYRKSSEKHNLMWGEAVDEALCFGWIDSVRKTLDEERSMQFFSKRKPKSTWSKINKQKVEKLKSEGLMAEAGLAVIERAKANGSWTILDAVEELIVPEDLENALTPEAKAYFESLSKSLKKMILHWIVTAKRPETRHKRITEVAEEAARNKVPARYRT